MMSPLIGRLSASLLGKRAPPAPQRIDVDALMAAGHEHALRDEWVESLQCFRRVTELDERAVDAWSNMARALTRNARYDEAVACCERGLAIDALHRGSYTNLGIAHRHRGELDLAEAALRKALDVAPDAAVAQYNLAMVLLLRGQYTEGFRLFEGRFAAVHGTRWSSPQQVAQLADPRRWQGEDLAGRRVLVWGEQGFGDVVMMLRYVPLIKARGAREIIVQCEPALARLVQSVSGVDATVPCNDDVARERYDVHVPIMSLAALFDTRQDAIPGAVPYLAVPQALSDAWRERLRGASGLKAGIAYAGASKLADDAQRSIALCSFEPILGVPGCTFVSLQKGDAQAQVADAQGRVIDWMDQCKDFQDTAALIANLDLVISVDTAVAHLAGALGVPVWLLNRRGSEWRWGLAGSRTPWYPSMRIARQREAGRWQPVLAEVAMEVSQMEAQRRS